MILLDTNALFAIPPRSLVGTVLRAITEDAGIEIGISSVTYDEYRARRLRDAERLIATARAAHEGLARKAERWIHDDVRYPEAEEVFLSDVQAVEKMLTLVPLAPEHAVEALRREAYRELPASTDEKKGSGARDVAVWLTAVKVSSGSGNVVYLVSNDGGAFGRKQLHQALADEAATRGANVRLCPDVAALIDLFAQGVDVALDVTALLDVEAVKRAVVDAVGIHSFLDMAMAVDPSDSGLVSAPPPLVRLVESHAEHAYAIRGEKWIAAHTSWEVIRDIDRHARGTSEIQEYRLTWDQRVTILLRVVGEGVVTATVMDLPKPVEMRKQRLS